MAFELGVDRSCKRRWHVLGANCEGADGNVDWAGLDGENLDVGPAAATERTDCEFERVAVGPDTVRIVGVFVLLSSFAV